MLPKGILKKVGASGEEGGKGVRNYQSEKVRRVKEEALVKSSREGLTIRKLPKGEKNEKDRFRLCINFFAGHRLSSCVNVAGRHQAERTPLWV